MEIGFCSILNFKETLIKQGNTDIVSIYVGKNDISYILDLVVFSSITNHRKYYCYAVSDQNIEKFFETKQGTYLLPHETQQVYIIQKNKKDEWEVLDIKKPTDCHLFFYQENFED